MTLIEHMTKFLEFVKRKHGKPDGFVENQVNALDNYEFLNELSDALEDWYAEKQSASAATELD